MVLKVLAREIRQKKKILYVENPKDHHTRTHIQLLEEINDSASLQDIKSKYSNKEQPENEMEKQIHL